MWVLSSGGRVSHEFSASPSGESMPQTQRFSRCKVLYHFVKFDGTRISPAAKNVEFLANVSSRSLCCHPSVCLSSVTFVYPTPYSSYPPNITRAQQYLRWATVATTDIGRKEGK